MTSSMVEKLCRQFSLAEMQLATGDFSDTSLIGKGGFGKVYKGLIDDGSSIVAVKRLASNSKQGHREFAAEMETLSKLQHRNLVSLIGYCNEQGEMILVYEYMPNGTLADHIHRNNQQSSSLTWKQRLRICIGAARGLDYLHTGSSVIHRDVKPTNILLDEKFGAKVSDFGLAKHLGGDDLESHVTASVKGSFGYFDPSYFISGRLTKASDTYAFGVVLLEVLSGRPAIDGNLDESELCLTMWAQEKIRKGKFHEIVASTLREEIMEDCLKTYVGVVKRCLEHEPKKRLSMTKAVVQLELALEQQERKGSARKLQFPSINAFWNRVAPSGSTQKDKNEVEVNVVPEDALQSKQSVDELEEQRNDREPHGVPAMELAELKKITNNFSSNHMISSGLRRGIVFHGILETGQEVAIKKQVKYWHFFEQGMFSSRLMLKHENVVELLGYCVDGRMLVLVQEYATRGSLHDILHGRQGPNGLSWFQRINIAVGAAKGLLYFHEKSMTHGNVKSSNVLVFGNEIAKISEPHLSARCRYDRIRIDGYYEGCCGYHPPEYGRDGFTLKGDIYNFGVVLFELLTGRINVGWDISTWEDVGLKISKYNQTELLGMIDDGLKADYPPKAAEKMAEVIELCLKHRADDRPSISDVLKALQIASQEPQDFLRKQSVDELEEQQNDREPYGVPAIQVAEIKDITDDFGSTSWIANGIRGGVIFHGVLKTGQEVAIKRQCKMLPDKEFLAQVSLLSGQKHENVLELLGYCVDGGVQVLVHEYAPRGSLHDILHGRQGPKPLEPGPALTWPQRIDIAVGAAKGLLYFHEKSLIHGNIKSSNVLVFADGTTKITDSHDQSTKCHSCAQEDGAFSDCGHHPPEYGYTEKGDIYNLGVVLLELLTDRTSSDLKKEISQFTATNLFHIVVTRLKGDLPPKAAARMAAVAEQCVKYSAEDRPSISVVLRDLQTSFGETQQSLLKWQFLGGGNKLRLHC